MIGSASGRITLIQSLDYELVKEYSLTIEARVRYCCVFFFNLVHIGSRATTQND